MLEPCGSEGFWWFGEAERRIPLCGTNAACDCLSGEASAKAEAKTKPKPKSTAAPWVPTAWFQDL